MILRLTGYLNKKKNRGWRISLASIFASSIVFVTVYFPSSLILYPIGKIIFSILIIIIAFKHLSWIEFIKTWLFFYFVSFTLGGILLGLHFIFDQSVQVDHASFITVSTGFGTPISWFFVVIGFPICWYFTKQTMDKQALINYQTDQLFKCQIQMLNKSVSVTGYLDSANHLTDPMTKYPVVIIDQDTISQFFNDEQMIQLQQINETLDLSKADASITSIIRLIPYQDVSSPAGLLVALKPESFIFTDKQETFEAKKVLIGLRFAALSSDQEYHCLLNPQLFKQI